MVADYCFVRDRHDQDLLTVLVARLYPSRAIIAIPCDVKGPDEYATKRLAAFLKASGVERLVYMCDQESALRTMIDSALQLLRREGTYMGAVPERSAVGESQSNGRAERSVQALENQVRTMKGILEYRIATRVHSLHPVLKWLVE